jgi:RQC domain
LTAIDCVGCGSAAGTERPGPTARGYRRCRGCGNRFDERNDSILDRTLLPSDIIAFVVFCRLRFRLTLRDLSEIMHLRGFTVSHECIGQWEAKLLPMMGEAFRKLIATGALDVDTQGHGGLFLVQEKARPILRGEARVMLRHEGRRRAVTLRPDRHIAPAPTY